MALPDPEPSPAERWRIRFRKTAKVTLLLIAQFLLFFFVLSRNKYFGAAASILVCYGVWQLISRIVTGSGFAFSIRIKIEKSDQLRDVLCTSFFTLNTVFFIYHLLTWYAYYQPGSQG